MTTDDDSPMLDALDLAEQIADPETRAWLFHAVERIAATVSAVEDEQDPEQLGLILATLDETHRAAVWAVKQRLLAVLPYGAEVPVSDVGTVTVKKGAPKVTYDNRLLVSRLAARLADEAVDRATGEFPPVAVIAERVAMGVAAAAGGLAPSKRWGSTELKKHGMNPGDFEDAEKQWGDPKVTFTMSKGDRK